MKILIIAKNVGRIAPGIVAERLIKGLSERHEVDVLSTDYDPSTELTNIKKVIRFKSYEIKPVISKILISFFSFNPLDVYIAKKVANNCVCKYDLIFSIVSSNHYVSLILGNKLSKKLKVKHFAHFLDAIPAPGGWLKDDFFYKGLKKFMARTLAKVDGVFASNQQMLDYQLSTFKIKKKICKAVIYNPGPGKITYYEHQLSNQNTFIFTGGIYGPRKPLYILKAFKQLLGHYPNSTLEFVGSDIPDKSLSIFTADELKNVIVHPFNRNLTDFYERATALIDIDADFPNDVFLSSKIINYISINRIIISETGENSPSRNIFQGIPSIIQTDHNANEIMQGMIKAIKLKKDINFNDRNSVISLFDLKSNIDRIENEINNADT